LKIDTEKYNMDRRLGRGKLDSDTYKTTNMMETEKIKCHGR
jgi:hypothetical protein